jgi:hypothetical protein
MAELGSNPFATVPAPAMNSSGNPFDPLGSPAPVHNAQQHYGAPQGMGMASPTPQPTANYGVASPGMNNAVGTPQPQQYPPQQQYGQMYGVQSPAVDTMQHQYPGVQQQQQMQQAPFAAPPQQYGQQPMQTPEQQPPAQQQAFPSPAPGGGYDPFGQGPPQTAYQATNQLVVSSQPSNPYGGVVAPAPPAPFGDYGAQSLVPATQQGSQWGMPQVQGYAPVPPAASACMASGSLAFDPMAPPPAPPPAPAPAPVYDQNPFVNSLIPGVPGEAIPAYSEPPAPAPVPQPEQQIVQSQQQPQSYSQAMTTTVGAYGGDVSERSQSQSRAIVPAPSTETRNRYSGELARRAPPGASPLPKADLVRKSGYVLSRISFRTIVWKKWKQSYWVQYGSHTMLWFRSQTDFDDWLNNPYHTQVQRNFLIKLAVNFVHDLYKPNVRGYQVTQCRSKPYGNKMVRQFKLERWMDYGPTIAAAFGSYDPKEVDALRDAIVECMRNTPLDGGIRATGAVRQHHEQPQGGDNGDGKQQEVRFLHVECQRSTYDVSLLQLPVLGKTSMQMGQRIRGNA